MRKCILLHFLSKISYSLFLLPHFFRFMNNFPNVFLTKFYNIDLLHKEIKTYIHKNRKIR